MPTFNTPEEFMAWHRETYPDRHKKHLKKKRVSAIPRDRLGHFMKTKRR